MILTLTITELLDSISENIEEEYKISNLEHVFYNELFNYIKNNSMKLEVKDYEDYQSFPVCFLSYKISEKYSFYVDTTYHPSSEYSNCIGYYRFTLFAKSKESDRKDISIVHIDIDIKGEYFIKDSYITENNIDLYTDICSELISN